MATTVSSPPQSPLFSRSYSGESSGSTHKSLTFSNVANLFVKMRRAKAKSHHIESSSGAEPQTHSCFQSEDAVSVRKVPLVENRTFVCRDSVDSSKLLRAVRGLLYKQALEVGANFLVDEQWTCTICGPRNRSDGTFRVYIHYTANVARSKTPDPQRPIALENARGVPGLMTIISRFD